MRHGPARGSTSSCAVASPNSDKDETLRTYLVETGSKVLVEASPVDTVWGTGLARDHVDASTLSKWRGLNLLGFALMQARRELRGGSV